MSRQIWIDHVLGGDFGSVQPVRYAYLGLGGIGINRAIPEGFGKDAKRGFNLNPNAVIIGAWSPHATHRTVVEAYNVRWYDSLDTAVGDKEVEAVFIGSDNKNHFPLAKLVMEHGKHPLVEKPMATTIKDASAMVEMAKEKKLSLAVNYMMRCNARNIYAAQLVKEGKIGNTTFFRGQMKFTYGATTAEKGAWRCSDPLQLGGPIGDVASHVMDTAEMVMGQRIVSLRAWYHPNALGINVEEGATIRFTFKDGAKGEADVSFNYDPGGVEQTLRGLGYMVQGSEGTLTAEGTLFQLSGHDDEIIKQHLILTKGAKVSEMTPQKITNIYADIISNHAASIRSRCILDGLDAVHNLELVLAAHESAKNDGKEVEIKPI